MNFFDTNQGGSNEGVYSKKYGTYDAQFDLINNILLLGTTASGKIQLSRDLIKKGFFKNLTQVYCVSTIKMSKEVLIEDNKNFPSHMRVRHYRINSAQDLSNVIETIKGLCEVDKTDDPDVRSIIVFDDVISVASKGNAYYTFLTYCRKYNVSTINIFQAVINQTNAWKVIVSNCPVLVMFQLGFTSADAARILNSVISMRRATTHSQSWLNRTNINKSGFYPKDSITCPCFSAKRDQSIDGHLSDMEA